MSALPAAGRRVSVPGSATLHVRVTDPTRAPELVSYFNRLGLHALGGSGGTIRVRPWADVELLEARIEIEHCIDSWVRRHGVPVQLI